MLGSLIGHGVTAGLSVSPNSGAIYQFGVTGTVYAGVQFNTSGFEFRNAGASSQAFTTSRGKWLDGGASSAVWIERTINGVGSLNWTDAGTGRLQLSTTREFGVLQTTDGQNVVNVTFDFYDAASGGSLLGSVTYDITADRGVL